MRKRPLVVIESPYAAKDAAGIEANVAYARAAMRDSLNRGESPLASHLLYTQDGVLRDHDAEERKLGIECGFAWGEHAETVAFYVDRGWSRGMKSAVVYWTQRDKSLRIAIRRIERPA